MIRAIVTGVFLFCVSSIAQAQLVNGDFSSSTLTNGTVQYQHIDNGWHSKEAGTDWAIVGSQLVHLNTTGGGTRAGQVFSASSLTGTGYFLNFDVFNTGINRVQVFAGTDDLTGNNPTNSVLGFGGNGAPTGNIVTGGSWTTLLDQTLPGSPGPKSFALAGDLGSHDLVAIRFLNGSRGAAIDNVSISTTAANPASDGVFVDAFRALNFGNTTGGNPGNSGIFTGSNPPNSVLPDPSVMGTASTTQVSGFSQSNGVGTMTFNVTDPSTGADFNFDVTAEALRSDGGGAVFRTAGNNLADNSDGNSDSRGATEAQAAGGWGESIRFTIDNITYNAGHTAPDIESFGLETLTINALGNNNTLGPDTGQVLDAITNDVLGSWDFGQDGINRLAVDAGDAESVVALPTGGNGFNLMGFQASFQFVTAVVPEPTSIVLWVSLGLALVGFALYRRPRVK